MAKATKKYISEFRDGLLPILQAHNVPSQVDVDKLIDSLMVYFAKRYSGDEKTPHWKSIVLIYFEKYREVTGDKPAFLGVESKALKAVAKVLMETYLHKTKDGIWDEETCIQQFNKFYDLILTIPLVRQNFSISYISNNLDKLRSQLAYKNKSQK